MATLSLKEKTAQSLFWGGINSGIQQLLSLFFGIFLARLLSPSDYGMVGMLTIFSLLANSLQESGFTAAIINKKEITHQDYNAVFWFSSLMGGCLYILLFFLAPYIAKFYNNPILTPLARYSFIGFFLSSLNTAQSAYLFKNLMIKQRAISTAIALVVSGTIGVLMAYYGFAYWGIATQNIVYTFTILCCYWYFSPWRPQLHIDIHPLKGMIAFSSRILATTIFTNINNNILSVLLGKFYSEKDVGNYNQANKWSSMGYSVVMGMISSVAQPILATVSDDTVRQRRVFSKMMRFTAFVAFPTMFGLSLIAPELITIAITEKWATSASIMQILCVGCAFIAINSLYSNLIVSKGKSNIYMWITIVLGIIQLSAMLYCSKYGIYTMISAYVAINIAWLAVWHFFAWREIHLSMFQTLKDILPFAIISAGIMLLTNYCTMSISNIYLLLLTKIFLAATLYIGIMWISGSTTFKDCLRFLTKKIKRS